ncbi:MAG: serine/threonine kinase [Myxococcaceae bacterium]|nr:serine/threonine kinase [Myxococcaceae bacterium]
MQRLPVTSTDSASSLPRDTEEGRALLQSRLASVGRLSLYLGLGLLVMATILGLALHLPGTYAAIIAQVLSCLLALLVTRLKRAAPLSAGQLIAIDYAFAWVNCGFFIIFPFAIPLYARPELVQLLCVTDVLAARAFLVPSTARRTASIGALPMLAVVLSTGVLYRHGVPYAGAPSVGTYMALAAIMGLWPLVITSFTSHTIFGLRERAREALQLGQYTLLEKIGEGGMGVVYKARHATLRRPTAIKLLPSERAGEHNLQRFEREVQLTCQLSHPNTIAIFDYGRSADGVLYYAMEYLDGLDLDSVVALTGPLSEARLVHVLAQVAGALSEAHEAGLIHRDIKPQNVLLCRRGGVSDVAKVVDFGLVKEIAQPPADMSLSAVDMIVGTPLYMSPEAIARPATLDGRGDLYALGCVGYFLLTGTPPFQGQTVVEICSLHLHAAPELPSRRLGRPVLPALEALLMRCLEKSPAARPESALALSTLLLELEVQPWTRSHAASWWHENQAKVTAYKQKRREDCAAESATPMATVAVDLRTRGRPSTPWQSAPTRHAERIEQ